MYYTLKAHRRSWPFMCIGFAWFYIDLSKIVGTAPAHHYTRPPLEIRVHSKHKANLVLGFRRSVVVWSRVAVLADHLQATDRDCLLRSSD